jgi:hypothetical protein
VIIYWDVGVDYRLSDCIFFLLKKKKSKNNNNREEEGNIENKDEMPDM